MIPHHIQRNRSYPPRLGTEPLAGLFDLRQIVGHDVDAPVHMNAVNHRRWIILLGITADKIRQQIPRQGAVSQVSKMQMSETIHCLLFIQRGKGCRDDAPALDYPPHY